MKKNNLILFITCGWLLTNCTQQNVLDNFPYSPLDENKTEFRILNVIPTATPLTGQTDTLKIGNVKYSSVITNLSGYYPSSTARYFAIPIGSHPLSLNYIKKTTVPVADGFVYTSTLDATKKGKFSAYIYNKDQAPIILEDATTLPAMNGFTDTVCFIRFVNLFHKSDGTTPYGKLTLKIKKDPSASYEWETIAANVDFGTQSEFYAYKLKNTANAKPWSGTETKMTLGLFNEDDSQFQQFPDATSVTKGYEIINTAGYQKGLGYVIYLNGKEGTYNNTTQRIQLSTYTTPK